MMKRSWLTRALYASSGSLLLALCAAAANAPPKGEWCYYSGDNGSTKYSPLDQINRSNVAKLRVAWRNPQIDAEFMTSHSNAPPQ